MKKRKAAPRRRIPAPLQELDRLLAALDPEASPAALAEKIVHVALRQPGVIGARLWRMENGQPVIWHQRGAWPSSAESLSQKKSPALPLKGSPHIWTGELGGDGLGIRVLEARGAKPLTQATRERLELLRYFGGVVLASSERRRAVDELSSIVEATKRLNSTLDLGELINIILHIATRQTDAERGTVFLVDRERNEIWSLVGLGLEQQEIRLPASKGIAGWVASHGETVNLEDAYRDPRFEPEVDRRLGYRTRRLLCLPIHNKSGETIGVLQLLNKRAPFTADDEGFLRALSDHVALALENAQLHRERMAKQRLERDLALARRIQAGLLPEKPPQLENVEIAVSHRSSQMVGGDYYDFVPIGPHALLTVIADVEGKGVASALVMANLQATLRALAMHLHSIEDLVSSINRMILADSRERKYMTMFMCMLEQPQRMLHYVNAGHVPPVVVRANGESIALEEGGTVVGLFPEAAYERGSVQLQPGDVLVGCTDGITEAADAKDNEYGRERLVQAVRRRRQRPAQEIVASVLEEVESFSRGGVHEDDRVLLVLKTL